MLKRNNFIKTNLIAALLITSTLSFAQRSKDYQYYDTNLTNQTHLTHSFIKTHMPAYAKHVQVGSNHYVRSPYNFYRDKNYQFSMFERDNTAQLSALRASSRSMTNKGLRRGQFLSKEDASAFLSKSTRVMKSVPRFLDFEEQGSCWLRATHISHELYQQYPSLPVMKVWLAGPMFQENPKSAWTYHVATAIPVKQGDVIDWMVMDDLLVSRGVVSVREWIRLTNDHHKFTAKVTLGFTASDRITPMASLITASQFRSNLYYDLGKALVAGDAAQSPAP